MLSASALSASSPAYSGRSATALRLLPLVSSSILLPFSGLSYPLYSNPTSSHLPAPKARVTTAGSGGGAAVDDSWQACDTGKSSTRGGQIWWSRSQSGDLAVGCGVWPTHGDQAEATVSQSTPADLPKSSAQASAAGLAWRALAWRSRRRGGAATARCGPCRQRWPTTGPATGICILAPAPSSVPSVVVPVQSCILTAAPAGFVQPHS
jgi:hypothetical protein